MLAYGLTTLTAFQIEAVAGPRQLSITCAEKVKSTLVDLTTENWANQKGLVFEAVATNGSTRRFSLDLKKRLGFGVGASVYQVEKIDGLPEVANALSGQAVIVKVPHRFSGHAEPIRALESKIGAEIKIYDELKAQIGKIEADPLFPAQASWSRGKIPTVPYVLVQTNQGRLVFKPEIRGMNLSAIYRKFSPKSMRDLPSEMATSLREVYDFTQAVYNKGRILRKGKEKVMSLDINPTNLIWVHDPEQLKALGLKRPSFFFYEFGEMKQQMFHQSKMSFESYSDLLIEFMRAQ
jgi:hypothetical protein